MKVSIPITIDLDVDAWVTDFGIPRSEVREDVRAHVREAVHQYLAGLGVLAERGKS